jgi:hypothetical protein
VEREGTPQSNREQKTKSKAIQKKSKESGAESGDLDARSCTDAEIIQYGSFLHSGEPSCGRQWKGERKNRANPQLQGEGTFRARM